MPSLPAAARLAAMGCWHVPAPASPQRDAEPQQRRRAAVRGGGPGTQQPGPGQHAVGGVAGLEAAGRQRCDPALLVMLPPLATGGGPSPVAVPAPAALHRAIDPALLALAASLGEGTCTEKTGSGLRQLSIQLGMLLASATSRLLSLLPVMGRAAAPSMGASQRTDAPAPVPLQPPPPPGPSMTLDPALGTIVDAAPGRGLGSSAGAHTAPDSAADGGTDSGVPTSWVPISGGQLVGSLRVGMGSLADRIEALFAELGLTRLQLLALVVAAPLATAFAIEVVTSILAAD